jgi:hypothetical protein
MIDFHIPDWLLFVFSFMWLTTAVLGVVEQFYRWRVRRLEKQIKELEDE